MSDKRAAMPPDWPRCIDCEPFRDVREALLGTLEEPGSGIFGRLASIDKRQRHIDRGVDELRRVLLGNGDPGASVVVRLAEVEKQQGRIEARWQKFDSYLEKANHRVWAAISGFLILLIVTLAKDAIIRGLLP